MRSHLSLKTEAQNHYVLDLNHKQLLLLPPAMASLLESEQKPAALINPPGDLESAPKVWETPNPATAHYYQQKIQFLKQHGYFNSSRQAPQYTTRLEPDLIRQSLANNRRVVFEVTDRCNLNCAYCGYGKFYCDYDTRENKNLDAAKAIILLNYLQAGWNSADNINDMKDIYVSFYGGEPLLNFALVRELTDYCQSLRLKKNRIRFMMTTNGMLLDKYMHVLVAEGFSLTVSLDGDEAHNSYRTLANGASSHAQVARNLLRLRKTYPDFFAQQVNINAVLHNRNSVEAVVRYCKTQFDKIPRILSLNPMGIREDRKAEFLATYKNFSQSLAEANNCLELESELFSQVPRLNALGTFITECSDFCFQNYTQVAYPEASPKRFPTATCLPFAHKIFLTVNGKLLPCEKIGFQYGLGQVTRRGVDLDFAKIAEQYNRYWEKFRGQCQRCYNYRTCGKCMFFAPLDKKPPLCDDFQNASQLCREFGYFIQCLQEQPELYGQFLPNQEDSSHA